VVEEIQIESIPQVLYVRLEMPVPFPTINGISESLSDMDALRRAGSQVTQRAVQRFSRMRVTAPFGTVRTHGEDETLKIHPPVSVFALRVHRLRYSNPLEMVLGFIGGGAGAAGIVALGTFLRDFKPKRRIAAARADDLEGLVVFRNEMRKALTESFAKASGLGLEFRRELDLATEVALDDVVRLARLAGVLQSLELIEESDAPDLDSRA